MIRLGRRTLCSRSGEGGSAQEIPVATSGSAFFVQAIECWETDRRRAYAQGRRLNSVVGERSC